MKYKMIVDVREENLKKHREWELAQAHQVEYSEGNWLRGQFHSEPSGKEILVKTKFKNWYGDWIEFKIGMDKNQELFLHDDGHYLSELEKNHADIYPEIRRQFLEGHSMLIAENKYDFILKHTGCTDNEVPNFLFQIQQYCLVLTHLVGLVIAISQISQQKVGNVY